MRFTPLKVVGYVKDESAIIDDQTARIVLLLSDDPPSGWDETLTKHLPHSPHSCVSNARINGRRITLQCKFPDIPSATSDLIEYIKSANQLFESDHRQIIETQKRIDAALGKLNLPQVDSWRVGLDRIAPGAATDDLLRMVVQAGIEE